MTKMQQDYTARFDAHNSRQSDSSYRYNDGYSGGGSSRNRGWGDSSSGRQGLGFGSGHQDRGSSRFSRACNSPARSMSSQAAAAAAANSLPTAVSSATLEEKQRLVESVAGAIATTARDPTSLSGSDTPNYNFILSRSIQACRTNPEYIYVQLKDIPMEDLPKNRKVPTDGYACELRCQSVYLATGCSGSKNGARDRASEQAVKLFLQPVEARVVQRKYKHAPVNDIVVCALHLPTPAMVPPLRNPEEKAPLSSKGIYEPDKSKHWTEFVVQDNAVDAICILNNSAAYNRMKIDYKFESVANSNIFMCNVFVQDQFVASARGTKKTSKHAAAEEALKKLRQNQAAREQEQQQRQQQQEQQRQQLLQQQLLLQQQQQQHLQHHQPQFSQSSYYSETSGGGGVGGGGGRFGQHGVRKKQLSELVILENSDNAICIINDTAQFNKVSAEYKFQVMPDHRWRCEVYLEGQYVAAGLGPKKTVKHIAAEEALATLRQTQAVVKSNLRKEGYADALSRNQILARSGEDAMQQEIKEDNIGNQLLRKMGWTGGGLGREGEGIAEPIRVKEQFTREGLGMDMSRSPGAMLTKRNIEEIIRNYAASDRNDDLRFSTELNNDERKQIHQVSQKYGLRSKSYGVGKQRFLIVSRKVHKDQLIGQLLQEGQVGRYELVKPQASH